MRNVLKLLLLGGAVGAAVVAVKSLRSKEEVQDLPAQAAKSAGMGAACGGLMGLVLDVRSRRKQSKLRRKLDRARDAVPRVGRLRRRRAKVAPDLHDLEKAGRRARKAAAKAAHKAQVKADRVAEKAREKLAS